MKMRPTPGTCRFCNCHGEACTLPDGELCSWFDAERTVCSRPACISAFQAVKAKRPPRPKRLNSADIHALICGRKKKSKKAA